MSTFASKQDRNASDRFSTRNTTTKKLESTGDARRNWSKTKYLFGKQRSHKLHRLIEVIDACGTTNECQSPLCPMCCREERKAFSENVKRTLAPIASEMRFVTVLLTPVSDHALRTFSLKNARDSLRAQLRRFELGTKVCIGFLEFKRDLKNAWLVPHWHLLMHAPDQKCVEEFRAFLKRTIPLHRPLHVGKCDLNSHATYHQKPSLLGRPWANGTTEREVEKTLVRAQALFMAKHEFADFRFFIGCKLSGGRIVLLATKTTVTT